MNDKLIKQLQEADLFAGPSKKDLNQRNLTKAEALRKEKEEEEKRIRALCQKLLTKPTVKDAVLFIEENMSGLMQVPKGTTHIYYSADDVDPEDLICLTDEGVIEMAADEARGIEEGYIDAEQAKLQFKVGDKVTVTEKCGWFKYIGTIIDFAPEGIEVMFYTRKGKEYGSQFFLAKHLKKV